MLAIYVGFPCAVDSHSGRGRAVLAPLTEADDQRWRGVFLEAGQENGGVERATARAQVLERELAEAEG